MQKIIYILLIFIIYYMPALAQKGPALQYANLPHPGEKVSFYIAKNEKDIVWYSYLAPGPSGVSQHWDFSNLVNNTGVLYMSYDSVPNDTGGLYHNATIKAINTPLETILSYTGFGGWNRYEYYKVDSTGFYDLGGNMYVYTSYPVFINTISTPSQLLIKVPFSFGDTISEKYLQTAQGVTAYLYPGAYQYIADGYGSLRVPGSTYDSVIRIHTIETSGDSITQAQTIFNSYYVEKYSWYNLAYQGQGFAIPVLEVGYVNLSSLTPNPGFLQDYIFFSDKPDSSPPPSAAPVSGYKGYYNSMLNTIVVQSGLETDNAAWQITDILGRRLNGGTISLMPGAPTGISCFGIAQGVYIFTFNHNNLKFIIP